VTDSANVELVRSIYADWEHGDARSAEWARPDIEVVFADGPAPRTWRGLAGLAGGWLNVLDAWEHFRVEVEQYRELDNERILVLVRWRGRGKRSGVEIGETGAKGAQLFSLRDGKVTRLVTYMDRDRALADLVVTPETDSPAT
jgi:ketosteroid isomerase-like protein